MPRYVIMERLEVKHRLQLLGWLPFTTTTTLSRFGEPWTTGCRQEFLSRLWKLGLMRARVIARRRTVMKQGEGGCRMHPSARFWSISMIKPAHYHLYSEALKTRCLSNFRRCCSVGCWCAHDGLLYSEIRAIDSTVCALNPPNAEVKWSTGNAD